MFSEILKKLRKERGITQIQFASVFGISSGTIAMWETNKRTPDIEMLIKISEFFNVSVDYLLGKTDQKNLAAKNDNEIGFDDFAYAMYNESKELSEEKKQQLLDMAKFFKSQLDNEKK